MNTVPTVAADFHWNTLDEAPAGILLFDADGACSYANPCAHRMLGYPGGALPGSPLEALLWQDGNDTDGKVMTAGCRLYDGVGDLTLTLRRADDSRIGAQVSSSRLPDRSLLLVIQDISALMQTLEQLRSSEAHYRALVEVTSDWLWEVDPDGVYTYASPKCRELMGYEPGEIVGRSAFDFMLPEQREEIRAFYLGVAARQVPFTAVPNTVVRKDGSLITVESSGVPVFDGDGRLVYYRGIDREITEHMRVEAALAEAQRIARLGNWEWDIRNDCIEWSEEARRIFDVEPQAFAGTLEALLGLVHPKDRTILRQAIDRILNDRQPLCVEHRIVRASGEERIIEARAEIVCTQDGAPARLIGTLHDVTEKHMTESSLQQLTQALENTREGVMIMDAHRRVIAVNKAYTALTGYDASEILGRNPFQFRTLYQDELNWQAIWNTAKKHGRWEGEVQSERKNGEFYNERLTIGVLHDQDGRAASYIGVISDISKQKQSEEQLSYLALHDTLTGLPNRQQLSDRLRQLISWSGRDAGGFALLQIDIDGFQTINNTLGQMTGNHVLQIAAERLQSSIRRRDMVARIGADEFALILEGVANERDADALIRKLHNTLAHPVMLGSDEIELGACIGAVFYPDNGKDAETLLQHADTALHRAKRQGRGVCRFYTPDMTTNVSERFLLERALRRAVRTGEGLSLHYQPQIDALTGRCVGVEALMRWTHPELGVIAPSRFIPVAEESSLIVAVGEWALDNACAELKKLVDAGLPPIRMAINVSSRQFSDNRLISDIDRVLQRYRLSPDLLEIELTESSLMENTMRAHSVLRQLKSLGVFIAIDDFGTGYSSLNYLKSFPLDILKIDKSFIDGIPGDEHDEAIARAVIAMAHGLKLRVTAEGVETREQRRFLQMHGCDFLQGYMIGKPVPADEFRHWLIENTRAQ